MSVSLRHYRFTVDEYYKMAEAGILTEDDWVELVDGEIVEMTPIGSRHAATVHRLNDLLVKGISGKAIVLVQNPIRLSEYTEPQPDLALLRLKQNFYADGHPVAEDVLLVMEVAETSVRVDREVKVPLYARAGIPEVWLIDLQREAVEVYLRPGPDGYQDIKTFTGTQLVETSLRPLQLAVNRLLPK